MNLLIASVAAVIMLTGCVAQTTTGQTPAMSQPATTSIANPLIVELTKIGNAGTGDLKSVEAVASVPNTGLPGGIEDQAGLQCAQAGVVVLTQIQAVNAAANGPGAGVLTLAEMASLFQPGSPQANQAQDTLATGCVAKANQVLGAAGVIAAGGVVGAMVTSPVILPLAGL
jgi:hypothetical protein